MVKYGQVCLLISEPVGFKYPGTLEDTTIPSETDDFGVEVNIDDMVSPIDSINSRRSSADIKRKISDGDNVPIAKRPSFGEEKAGNRIMTLAQTASDSRGYMSYAKRPIEGIFS